MKAVRVEARKPCVVDIPKPSGEGVRIDVVSASICGSDLHMAELGMVEGVVLGHEFAGTTPDGTPVAVEPIVSCGECLQCGEGRRFSCTEGSAFIGGSLQGGMAEHVVVPESTLTPRSVPWTFEDELQTLS